MPQIAANIAGIPAISLPNKIANGIKEQPPRKKIITGFKANALVFFLINVIIHISKYKKYGHATKGRKKLFKSRW